MSDSNERSKSAKTITLVGSAVNLLLLIIKLTAGILAHSRAMVADAVHTITDFATDVIVYLGIHFGKKEEDADHPWGHGKYEIFAAWFIALSLIAVSVGIATGGIRVVADIIITGEFPPRPGPLAFIAAIVSLISKEALFRVTILIGRKTKNPAVIANAWHHRSDSLSSAGVALGIAGATFFGDFWTILDPLSALIVSGFIFKAGFSIIKDSSEALMEKGLEPELLDRVRKTIGRYPTMTDVHHLRCRMVGARMVIEMHVRMDGTQTLSEAHNITAGLENDLRREFGPDLICTIHMEPQ